jgi:hypothetical protein
MKKLVHGWKPGTTPPRTLCGTLIKADKSIRTGPAARVTCKKCLASIQKKGQHMGVNKKSLVVPAELRVMWEGDDADVVCELTHRMSNGHLRCFLVVMRTGPGYRCLRYFRAGFGEEARWEVSVDGACVDADMAIRWLGQPSAIKRGGQ